MNASSGPITLHLPDGQVLETELKLVPVYHPWTDQLTCLATITVDGATFTLDETRTQLRGSRRDVARTLNIVTGGTTPELTVPVRLEGEQDLLDAHREAAADWLQGAQARDRRHHRPVLITHPGNTYSLGYGRRLSQGEQQAARHGTFAPPGAVLAHFLPREKLPGRPDLDLENPGENDTTEAGDRLHFIRPGPTA